MKQLTIEVLKAILTIILTFLLALTVPLCIVIIIVLLTDATFNNLFTHPSFWIFCILSLLGAITYVNDQINNKL